MKKTNRLFSRRLLPLAICISVFAGALFIFVGSSQQVLAANPATINFQGKVVNSDGTNVSNGSYSFVFRLYQNVNVNTYNPNTLSCAADTNCWWEETDTLTVTNGVFQVALGATCAFTSACNSGHGGLNFNTQNALSLTVKFNGDANGFMTPLVAMQSVPYAFQADNASALSGLSAGNFVQLAQSLQTDSSTNESIAIKKTGSANILDLQNSTSTLLVFANTGALTVSPSGNNIGATFKQTSGTATSGDVFDVQTSNGTSDFIQITNAAANEGSVVIQSVGATRNLTLNSSNGTLVLGTNTTTLQKSGSIFTLDVSNGASNSELDISDSGGAGNITLKLDTGGVYAIGATTGSTISTCGANNYVSSFAATGGLVTGGSCSALSSGVTTVGSFSGSSQTNGASISTNTITFGPADTTNPGMVSTGSQTFAGAKAFRSLVNTNTEFQVQNSSTSAILNVDTTTSNLVTNSSIEASPLANWTYSGTAGSVARDTTQAYIGGASLKLTPNNGAPTAGIADSTTQTLATTLSPSTTYFLSWYGLLGSGAIANMTGGFSFNGAKANFSACTGLNTTTLSAQWVRVTCTFTTGSGGTAPTAANAIYIGTSTATSSANTYFIDGVMLIQSTTTTAQYSDGKVQINGTLQGTGPADFVGMYSRVGPVDYAINLPGAGTNSAYSIIDKGNTGSDASLLFRDGGAVRGEIGLVGDDSIHIKTVTGSAGSETYTDQIVINTSNQVDVTGALGVGTVPAAGVKLHVADSQTAARVITKIENTNVAAGNSRSSVLQFAASTENWLFGTDFGLNTNDNFFIQDANDGTGRAKFFIDGSTGNVGLDTNGTLGAAFDIQNAGGALPALKIATASASTADIVSISNSGVGTSTTGVSGLAVNFSTAGSTASADNSGLRVDVTSNNSGATTTLEGLKIGDLTSPEGNSTETGLYVGTGWDIGLDLQSGGIQLAALASNPPTPTGSNLRVYAKQIAGRTMLKSLSSAGVDYALQPSLFQQSVFLETPGTGATLNTYSATGGSTTSTGTLAAAGGGASESQGFMGNMATGTTAGNTAGTGNNVAQYYRGSVANGADGYFFFTRISLPDALAKYASSTTGSRLWFGLTDQANATMVGSDNPTGNYSGFQFSGVRDTSPADFKFITKNGATQHVTDTGVVLAVSKTYDFYIYCSFQCSSVNWRIDNQTDGTAPVEGIESNDLPTASTPMRSGIQIATLEAVAHNLRFQRIYVETDR